MATLATAVVFLVMLLFNIHTRAIPVHVENSDFHGHFLHHSPVRHKARRSKTSTRTADHTSSVFIIPVQHHPRVAMARKFSAALDINISIIRALICGIPIAIRVPTCTSPFGEQ